MQIITNIAYLGTSSHGGTGTDPLDEDAHIVKWDIDTQVSLFDVVPEPHNKRIRSILHMDNGLYAVTQNYNLYLIDSATGEIIKKNTSQKASQIIRSVDGNLYGIYKDKFFSVDKSTLKLKYFNHQFNQLRYIVEDKIKNKIYLIDTYNLFSFQ
jgi:hypothetical protein